MFSFLNLCRTKKSVWVILFNLYWLRYYVAYKDFKIAIKKPVTNHWFLLFIAKN